MNLKIKKTIKLFINNAFVRSESERVFSQSMHGSDKSFAEICQASRKDFRSAVEAAKKAESLWSTKSAYNRAQIVYRMAEMLEGKRAEFVELASLCLGHEAATANKDVDQAIDNLVYYAGFADKFSQVSATLNPVQGNLHNFSFPEPVGVVALICDDRYDLGRLMAEIASIVCSGNTLVCLLGSECPAVLAPLAEVLATSDLPAGTINLLSGHVDELYEHIASHMELRAIAFANNSQELYQHTKKLAVENMKRVVKVRPQMRNLETITDFVEYKTTWHPVAY